MAKRGRPKKYDSINLEQVEYAGGLGLTDKEISKLLGISEATLNNYKKQYPEFLESLKKGKEIADEEVIKSLYRRALGYSHPEVHISNYQGKVTVTDIIKHYPPDVMACVYWLNNRIPTEWKNRREDISSDDKILPIEINVRSNSRPD